MSIPQLPVFSYQHVAFSSISISKKWNLHPWKKESYSDELKNSILQTGVLHPPILQQTGNGVFDTVTGNARIAITRKFLKQKTIGCFILPDRLHIQSILRIILEEQACSGQLSIAEKARFLEIAVENIPEREIISHFLPLLALPRSFNSISKILEVLSLGKEVLTDIYEGLLQEKIVMELLNIREKPDRQAIVSLFRMLGVGAGKQKKILYALRDLSKRHQQSISDYLKDNEITAILEHEEMNPPQKAHHLTMLLETQLTPASAKAENEFKAFTKSLDLPAGFQLNHSPSFEKDTLRLTLFFQNKEECTRLIQDIKTVFSKREQAD
ncbi:hypothetical protein [Desulfomarina sp.]